MDGWNVPSNDDDEIAIPVAATFSDRKKAAGETCRKLDVDLPFLLDTIDDTVAETYSAFPDRLYLIDRDGRVAHKGGRGPHGFDPATLERALLLALVDEDSAPQTAAE